MMEDEVGEMSNSQILFRARNQADDNEGKS